MSVPVAGARSTSKSTIRIIYRTGDGQLHLTFPVDRLNEAIDDTKGTVWVDIFDPDGQSNGDVDRLLREVFRFHPLAIDDALNESHIPKVDDWGDHLYLVFHICGISPGTVELSLRELDIFLGKNYLITYHTEPLHIFDQDRQSIERDPRDRLRHGPDHLLYRFLELGIDQSLESIQELDDQIDVIQNQVIEHPSAHVLHSIFRIKRSAIRLHKILSPQREVLNRLARDPFEPIQPRHRVYFRDLYDHVVRIHDISEGLRDLISGALETYLSVVSNRTNETMKTLTVVTVMFLPMSFLASFFGMNFFGDNLVLREALPRQLLFWGTCIMMGLSPIVIWIQARRKKWF
jgi:magnesium transporter